MNTPCPKLCAKKSPSIFPDRRGTAVPLPLFSTVWKLFWAVFHTMENLVLARALREVAKDFAGGDVVASGGECGGWRGGVWECLEAGGQMSGV